MSLIVPNLILGGFDESFDQDLLAHHDVTHILNVASECNVLERVGRAYAKHSVPDDCLDADSTHAWLSFVLHMLQTNACWFIASRA